MYNMKNIYSEPVFRPPSEAFSTIIQLNYGCPYNKCRFCAMYKGKKYYEKSFSELKEHLMQLKQYTDTENTRAFLADGDALFIDQHKLLNSFNLIKHIFPQIRRIGIYGSFFSLKTKTIDDLKALRQKGLRFIYLGIESGDENVLKVMNKNTTSCDIIESCLKVMEADISLSVTLILGLGGMSGSFEHIKKSAEIINKIKPTYTNLLSLMLSHTPLENNKEYSSFGKREYLSELKTFIKLINCRTIFRNNHASNFLPLKGRLPLDKEKLLRTIVETENFFSRTYGNCE